MATLKDIAKRANVSFQAVSSALNGRGNSRISKEKRELILKVAEELNYQPDRMASGLRTRRSRTIGVIFPGTLDAYYAELMHLMLEELAAHDYIAIFSFALHLEPKYMETLARDLFSRRIDALIAYAPPDKIPAGDIPILYVPPGTSKPLPDKNSICIDFNAAMPKVIRYLKEIGHHHVAYIGSTLDDRFKSFLESVKMEGMQTSEEWIHHGWGVFETGEQGAEKILRSKKRPTAIVAFNDITALSAISTLQRKGFDVPRDFSVTGFDNITNAAYSFPRLTTFDTDIAQTAKLLVGSAMNLISGTETRCIQETIVPKLILRESCGKYQI